jgi:hypothetical protein
MLAGAKILDVDMASQSSVEKHVPTGVDVVVVHIDGIPTPPPIPAVIYIVGSYHPS